MNTELIGIAAGAFTTLSFVPQVIQVVKTKSTKDISLPMFLMFTIGIFLWLVYGLLNSFCIGYFSEYNNFYSG